MYNLDLGYLTFKMSFGNYDWWEIENGRNIHVAAWDNKPKRKELSKAYKYNRSEGKEEIVEKVRILRDRVLVESKLPIVNLPGSEADDIVACWNLFNPLDEIIGIDKDFFQLPSVFTLLSHKLEPYHFSDMVDKQPMYLQELADNNFALYQMLMGDVADGIPRILSKGKEGKEQVQECLNAIDTNNLESTLINMFDEQIIDNAKLILFPFYQFSDFVYPDGEFFECWCEGDYHNKVFWKSYYEQITEARQEPGYFQLELFDIF